MTDTDKTAKAADKVETTLAAAPKRQFVQGKTYLRDKKGQIWEYEALLANKSGFTAVIPNPAPKPKTEENKS